MSDDTARPEPEDGPLDEPSEEPTDAPEPEAPDADEEASEEEEAGEVARDEPFVRDPHPKERLIELAMFLVPLLLYLPLLHLEITYGDGPELLMAIQNFGGAHPSGYPLLMVLGKLVAHIPVASPHFNVSLLTGAIPGALTALFLYKTARETDMGPPAAALTGLVYALNYRVLYQSTRVEVYALHCMLIAAAFWAMGRHARVGPRVGPRWLLVATGAVCLGLTNHLTTAFMIPIVILCGALVDWRQLFTPKTIGGVAVIAAACASLYLYMPLHAASAADGSTVSWNDPQTLERFWFHVTGEEYRIFRSDMDLPGTFSKIGWDFNRHLFPGVAIVAGLGLFELATRRWRLALLMGAFAAGIFAYISGYTINDIDTYYSPIYLVVIFWMGFGFDWFVTARFPLQTFSHETGRLTAMMLALVGVGALYWSHRGVALEETYGEDMGDQIVAALPERAIVFTSVDHHTFPMWYQAYVKHPDRDLVVVDRVMFGLENKQWYRDHLRARHPEIDWPSDELATSKTSWETDLIRANKDTHQPFALLARRWRERDTFNVNVGWHHEIHLRGEGVEDPKHGPIRHIYTTQMETIGGKKYFYDAEATYSMDDNVLCMVEWQKHQKHTGTWVFYGPGDITHRFKAHAVPPESNLSWEFLPDDIRVPGKWRCEVSFKGKKTLVTHFELVE